MRLFPARYDGTCADCRERIYTGEDIRIVDGLAVHDECDDLTPAGQPARLAPLVDPLTGLDPRDNT